MFDFLKRKIKGIDEHWEVGPRSSSSEGDFYMAPDVLPRQAKTLST